MFGQDKGNDTAADGVAGSARGAGVGQKKQRNRQKKYATQEAKVARDRELRQKRAAAKAGLEERFLQHRAGLEKRRQRVGPRKFGEWMREFSDVLAMQQDENVEIPWRSLWSMRRSFAFP